jgi:hypothetical protein
MAAETFQPLHKAINLTGCVNNTLLTRKERMAFRANIGANVFRRRTGRPCVAARANHRGFGVIRRVNIFSHFNLP